VRDEEGGDADLELDAADLVAQAGTHPSVEGGQRLVEQKNHELAIRAISQVPGATLAIVGDGPLRPELERVAAELDAPVIFTGVRRDARALMGAAGAPMPMYLSFIEPASTFNLSYTVSALGSAIIGGMSHWAGPIVGALLLSTLQQIVTVTVSGEVNVLIIGVLLVLFVVLAPDGILGLFKRWLTPSSK